MRSKLFELIRTAAANTRSRPWLAATIPHGLEQLLRERLFTTEYILHLAYMTKAVKDSPPPASDYSSTCRWRIGIVRDLFYNHESYIAACRELNVPYKTVDLFASIETLDAGIAVDATRPMAIAAAIRKLRDKPELRCRLGSNGRAAVLKERNWNGEAQKLIAVYKELGL
jgi:hypothetical protein